MLAEIPAEANALDPGVSLAFPQDRRPRFVRAAVLDEKHLEFFGDRANGRAHAIDELADQ